MRTDLDHLPPAKQRELERIIQILFEEFEDAKGNPTGEKKLGRILKIILYGSHARGGWVDEPHTAMPSTPAAARSQAQTGICIRESTTTA